MHVPHAFQDPLLHPAVYELNPIYDAVARLTSQAHSQIDVLATLAIGTGIGTHTIATCQCWSSVCHKESQSACTYRFESRT